MVMVRGTYDHSIQVVLLEQVAPVGIALGPKTLEATLNLVECLAVHVAYGDDLL